MHDHLSWSYRDRGDFVRRVNEFLRDGLALGLRCMYTADRPLSELVADLAPLPDLQAQLDRGALMITTMAELYDDIEVIDSDVMLASLSATVEETLAQGYAGLRIAADVTPLVRTPEQLCAFAAWEHTVDRYVSGNPLSGLCGFDRTQVSDSAAVVLAGMHPVARAGSAPFGVFATDGPADLAVAGEIDVSVAREFRTCLGRTRLGVARELVVDGTRLDFVDHRGLETIRDFASGIGATAVLRTSSGLPARLIGLLGLEGIRAEPAMAEEART